MRKLWGWTLRALRAIPRRAALVMVGVGGVGYMVFDSDKPDLSLLSIVTVVGFFSLVSRTRLKPPPEPDTTRQIEQVIFTQPNWDVPTPPSRQFDQPMWLPREGEEKLP